MIDYLTYYYRQNTEPFQTLSALPTEDAVQIMQALYIEGSVMWERFKNPQHYLQERKQVEQWLRTEFIAKGGEPQMLYPIYMMLGRSKWADRVVDAATLATTVEIQVPLSILKEGDVSFTYLDSMTSHGFGRDKPVEYYQPDYHGKVFTLSEMLSIVEIKGLPEEGWEANIPNYLPHYIEAQVWNREPLLKYKEQL